MRGVRAGLVAVLVTGLAAAPGALAQGGKSGAREVSSGPFSVSIHGGSQQNAGTVGIDGRFDWLRDPVNVHLFGTFELLDNGTRFGGIDNQRFGAGLAFSHTYGEHANAFVGTSFIHETGETFGQIYLGGKLRVADPLFLEGSYGFGLGSPKRIRRTATSATFVEAVDWAKLGLLFVPTDRFEAKASLFVNDLWKEGIAGLDTKLAYYLTPNVSIGFQGDTDLTRRRRVERNWRSMAFVELHFGGQRGKLREVALSTGDPVSYPKLIRRTKLRATPAAPAAYEPLTLSPSYYNDPGCDETSQVITASGGVPPYHWSIDTSNGGGLFTPNYNGRNDQALWNENCIDGGYDIVIVTDSAGHTAQAIMDSANWYGGG